MQRLLVSPDQSFVLSAQVALDAHDIPHVDEPGGTPWAPQTAILVHERDFDRALHIVRGLQTTVSYGGLAADRIYPRVFNAVIALFVLGFAAFVVWQLSL